MGSYDFSDKRRMLPQPRLFLWSMAACLRRRRCHFLPSAWKSSPGILRTRKKTQSRRSFFAFHADRDSIGACDWIFFRYCLGPSLLGLQRIFLSFPWLYLYGFRPGLWHCGHHLDLLSIRHSYQALAEASPIGTNRGQHSAHSDFYDRLCGFPDFSKHRKRHHFSPLVPSMAVIINAGQKQPESFLPDISFYLINRNTLTESAGNS